MHFVVPSRAAGWFSAAMHSARLLFASLLALSACAGAPIRTDHTPTEFDPRTLEGTWYVVGSSFPMWKDEKKTAPTFDYSGIDVKEGVTQMNDHVSWLEGEEQKSVDGTDFQSKTVPTHFTWKGTGIKGALSSEWDVVFIDKQSRFLIIAFSRTLATPAGLDVIARTPTLADSAWSDALGEINAWDELREKSEGLVRLPLGRKAE